MSWMGLIESIPQTCIVIVTQGKSIFNLSFINKGILKVSDILLNDSGNLLSWQLGKSSTT